MNTALIDLHLHLDGSLNIQWAYQKAISKKVIPSDYSFQQFYQLLFSKNTAHSEISITKFDLTCDLLQTYQDLYEATYNLVEYLSSIGLIYAEIRFASQHHTKQKLTQLEATEAVINGAKAACQKYPIKIGIINALMHKGDSAAVNDLQNRETVEVCHQLLNKGLVGIDLAGYENNCDYKQYGYLVKLAKLYKIPVTLHAGEMGIAEHIDDALAMNPDRIGHGINCINKPEIMQKLIDTQIPLEICVTSNIKTTMDYSSHPIREFIDKGLNITINSDNMTFARTDIVNEHHQLQMLGISQQQLIKTQYNAIDAAFCDEETKQQLRLLVKERLG